jgi:MFS family permease
MSLAPSRLLAIRMVFALNALGFAVWFPRIPDVKAALGLDLLTLSFCLFALPAGTLLGFLFVGRVTLALGLRRTCMYAGSGFFLVFILPALAPTALALGLALFLTGLATAQIEVAMNAKASQTEAAAGRRIMTSCHGFWSFGMVLGAPIGGAFAEWGIGFAAQQLLIQPALALASFLLARRLLADDPRPREREPAFALPTKALIALCLMPTGALLVEGAMMEWSALFLREHVGASPFGTALAFAAFALAMALARLSGDRLADAVGPRPVLLASGLLMGVGILGFALAPALWLAIPFAALTGIGCANVYPLAVSLAGQVPGRRPEQNVAALALVAFTAFLVGPPAIGTLASALSLPVALALLTPLGLIPLAALRRRRLPGAEAIEA